jgi:glycosyltransferase involved in cell wall biosynthesis
VVHKKGFDLLVKAMTEPAFPPDLDVVIGGDGPALDDLRHLAGALGLAGRAYFPGRLDRARVARYMQDAELFVMPSRLEPFGVVVLEAWRAGTPVIATVRGGPPEFIIDGADGVLVDPLAPGALATAVRTLHDDPQRRAQVGLQGREKVRSFTWSRAAGQYREVYQRVLSTQHPGIVIASAGAGADRREGQ